jgi:hypothetical protein
MLFDLRGRGRRRTVRILYTGLALLMGVGLVGFGIGGGFGSGGIVNSLTTPEGSNSASFSNQIKKYRKLTVEHPNDTSAWENLTKNLLHEAGSEAYVTSSGAVTSKGKELFHEASEAWDSYIALNPPKPSGELAQLMESVYGEEGLDEPAKEVEVLQIAVADRPTDAALYAQLAEYAYKAHNVSVGDLASEKAVNLVPAAEKKKLEGELAEVKANPSGEKTLTTTTDGKTYVGKLNSKGEVKAKEVPSTSVAGKSSSTKAK